jgi:hypothetical protein
MRPGSDFITFQARAQKLGTPWACRTIDLKKESDRGENGEQNRRSSRRVLAKAFSDGDGILKDGIGKTYTVICEFKLDHAGKEKRTFRPTSLQNLETRLGRQPRRTAVERHGISFHSLRFHMPLYEH